MFARKIRRLFLKQFKKEVYPQSFGTNQNKKKKNAG